MHAVLADCYRALHRWTAVEELWTELKAASPDPVVMADGRMVMAGALADRGKLEEAIALLEQGMGRSRKAQPYHLKQWYALADLYERAGDVPAPARCSCGFGRWIRPSRTWGSGCAPSAEHAESPTPVVPSGSLPLQVHP